MSKILAVVASPRSDGNCVSIVNAITDGAMGYSTNVLEIVNLNTLRIMCGCQACMGCKITGYCVTRDELTPLLNMVKRSDTIIVATPIYFGHASGQYRLFEDRMFSFIDNEGSSALPGGKKLVTVVTCGEDTEIAEAVADEIEDLFTEFFSFKAVGRFVHTDNGMKHAAKKNDELMENAKQLGKRL